MLTCISSLFQKQKETLLSELRTFVVIKANLSHQKEIAHLETKIDNQSQIIKHFSDYLTSVDRETFAHELKVFKEEKQKLLNEINNLQESERQLKRECKFIKKNLKIEFKL